MKSTTNFAKIILICFLSIIVGNLSSLNTLKKVQQIPGKWSIQFNNASKTVDFIQNGKTILKDVIVKAKVNSDTVKSNDYSTVQFFNSIETDGLGEANKYIIEYSMVGKPTIQQIFYLYADKDYFLTEVKLISSSGFKISSNYIAPIYTRSRNNFLPVSQTNRMLFVPYDNDGFVRYGSLLLNTDTIAFEVTSIFNGESQNGFILGSVEHDVWKSAVRMSASGNVDINKLECFSGVTNAYTHDNVEHGSIRKLEIKSAKMMVGFFKDWRTGLETFGEVNAVIAPPRTWTKGTPFGWNSWGGMNTHVNYDGVISVSDFIKDGLQTTDFTNNGTVYLGLDSYWDNLVNASGNDDLLKSFADHCIANGQTPGIYWTPFCDWFGWNRTIEGSSYQYKDAWTYANSQPKSLDGAKCMDPTHPGTLARMDYFINRFKKCGFKYIKFDFLTNGSIEGDFFYDRNVTTGTQAYNYGMKYLSELCGDDIFIAESIAPLFPSQYGHSRRISCDAWGTMWHTEYELNSLSFGWWLNRVYPFNDADHIVLYNAQPGENRARVTSGVITGIYMLGDNLSSAGDYQGNPEARERVKKFCTNTYINDIARIGKSFRPVYGHTALSSDGAIDMFTYDSGKYAYLAYFNYGGSSKSGKIDLKVLGIDASQIINVKELWMKVAGTISEGSLTYSVPAMDVRVYRMEKNVSDVFTPRQDNDAKLMVIRNSDGNTIDVKCTVPFEKLKITSLQGVQLLNTETNSSFEYSVEVDSYPRSVYIVTVQTAAGQKISARYIR